MLKVCNFANSFFKIVQFVIKKIIFFNVNLRVYTNVCKDMGLQVKHDKVQECFFFRKKGVQGGYASEALSSLA